jgi:hypothetical protein
MGPEGIVSFNSTEIPGINGTIEGFSKPPVAELARKPWSTPTIIQSELSRTAAHVTYFTDGSRAGIQYGS